MDYEELVQDALRSVVHQVLKQTQEVGLSGPHHFYIAFATNYPGVEIPDFLRETNPEEVTIVLQHQFWDLEVEEAFLRSSSVSMMFLKKIRVPFGALLNFMDPGVKFGLQFTPITPDIAAELTPDPEPSGPSDNNDKPKKGNVIALDLFRKNK